jgi:precorrin-2/cobalt-factor-2 C20-methyltransferase
VAFVTLGDPNVYSPFPALGAEVHRIRPEIPLDTVPGIMAFQELAARTGTVVANDGELLALVTLGDDPATLDALLDRRDATVVIYKGGRQLPAVARALGARDRLEGTVVGELLGLPGERSVPLRQVADLPGSYLATTIVPAQRGPTKHHPIGHDPARLDGAHP